MTRGAMLVIAVLIVLQGCSIYPRIDDVIDKDADEVKAALRSHEFTCGQEYSQKTVGKRQILKGVFVCLRKTIGFRSPDDSTTIFFDLQTRKVEALGR